MSPDPLGEVYEGIRDSAVPEWAVALTSASAMGVYLVDDPIGFVLAVVYESIVEGALTFAGQVAVLIMALYREVASVVLGILMIPLGLGGVLGDVVLSLVGLVTGLMDALAAAAGPFAPVVIALMWVVVAYVVLALLNLARKALPLVIPWL